MVVHDPRYVNPNDRLRKESRETRREADLLPRLAEMAKQGKFRPVCSFDTLLETWRLPNLDSMSGKFYGAMIHQVPHPINFSRMLSVPKGELYRDQLASIQRIRNPRFLEIQKVTGAYQGPGKWAANQLFDAYFLWTAEFNSCPYFLTMDFKLIKMVSDNRMNRVQVRVVRPSELLVALGGELPEEPPPTKRPWRTRLEGLFRRPKTAH
jgi:hypothetical protein